MLARAIRPTAVIAAGAGTALYGAHIAHLQSQPIRCDAYPAALKRRPDLQATRSGQARPGPKTRAGSIVNPAILRQITSGSICGVLGGLALSVLSKPLTVIFGALIMGVSFLEWQGLRIIPYRTIHRYLRSVNIKPTSGDNVAFRLSCGLTLLMATFAQF